MISGQPIFIVGVISFIAGLCFTFKHHWELFWFGICCMIAGFILSLVQKMFFYDDEPDCECEMCKPQKFDPNDYK